MAYCTNTEVKTYLGITAATDDTLLTSIIARVQDMVDRIAGMTFEASADSTHKFDALKNVSGAILTFDTPLCAITSVTNGDTTTIASTKYVTNPRNVTPWTSIELLSSSGLFWTYNLDPQNAITIVGRWAYSTSAPATIHDLCLIASCATYRLRDNPVGDTVSIESQVFQTPKDVAQFIQNQIEILGLRKY